MLETKLYFSYKKIIMQQIFLLIFFIVSPILLFAQSPDTEKHMQELGFIKVDLNELSKAQSTSSKACSSCPLKQSAISGSETKINHKEEIKNLKAQLPRLEQLIKDTQVSNNTYPMLQKYQMALKNTKDRINLLEKELNQSKSSSK